MIDQLVSFAENVRREGLLAQECRLGEIRDPFLAEGLHLVVDGLQPETVKYILNSEIEAIQLRKQQERNIILHCGRCAPAFGMLGTVIGLVMMLTNLQAELIGPGMAIALLTTFYGVLAAHLFFLPVAEKMKQWDEYELRIKSMIVCGVLGIQAGEHPRIIQLKLLTFLPLEEKTDDYVVADDDLQTMPFLQSDAPQTSQAA